MGEAGIRVPFREPNGDLTYRTFYIDVTEDDTYATIADRVLELIDDYLAGQIEGSNPQGAGLETITRGGVPIYDVFSWPLF